jgi:serine/threonine protein phosphatase PrpC
MTERRITLSSYAGTDVGRRRENNEDAFLVDDELGLWVVADGMGGQAAGEVASQQAVETVHGMVLSGLRRGTGNVSRILESAVQAATYMVYGLAELDSSKAGMGTTLSAVLRQPDRLVIAQVGDSRVYRVRDGQAIQLTEDHTLVNWQIQQGLITAEQAKQSKQKNVITRAVGNRDYVQVDIFQCDVAPGDVFVLCSDGLYSYIQTSELPDLVSHGGDVAVQSLIDRANERGGRDNITVALVVAREDPQGVVVASQLPPSMDDLAPETAREPF